MIRTLVIDDEPLLRQYIKNSITDSNPDFSIIGEAGNGEEAWSKIQDLSPDVIFIDIKMPLLDGLEVLERCSALKTPPLSIILSGYSEFAYAQRALKHHTFDYILKPVDQNLLKQLLDRIQDKLTIQRTQIQNAYFYHLLHNQNFPYSPDELNAAFSRIPYFYTYYICIGSYSTYRCNQFNDIGDYWSRFHFDSRLLGSISVSEQLWLLHEEPQNECYIILGTTGSNPQRQDAFADRIQEVLHASRDPVSLIYGLGTDSMSGLRDHFIELNNAAANRIIFSRSSVHRLPGEMSFSADTDFFTYAEQKILQNLAADRKYTLFIQQLLGYLERCENEGCRQCMLNQLLKRICEIANRNRLSASLHERIDELITNSADYKTIREGIYDILNDIFHTFPETSSTTVAAEIKSYIDQHYTEQISLTRLAQKFNFSISYVSSLFKNAYQISPNEYLIRLRIDRAKTLLLENTQANIRQTAELVGYNDPYYFSRLFKMTVGISPSDYRRNAEKNRPEGGQ